MASPPSADFVLGYQSGWNDCKAIRPNLYPPPVPAPIPVPMNPAPAVRVISPNENIQQVIDTTAFVAYQLALGAKYTLAGNWQPKRGGWSLDCLNASVTFTEPASASSVVKLTLPNITIRNMVASMNVTGQDVLFRISGALCSVINCTYVGPIIATFGFVDVGGVHALFSACMVPVTNSCSFYSCEDDSNFSGNTLHGSVGETVFRFDNSPTGKKPAGIVFFGNTVYTVGGTNQKGCGELRSVDEDTTVTSNIFYDYVRVGQAGMTSVTQSVVSLLLSGNIWKGVGTIPENLMIMNGAVTVSGNTFLGPHPPVTLAGPATVAFSSNVSPVPLFNPANKPANVTVSGDAI